MSLSFLKSTRLRFVVFIFLGSCGLIAPFFFQNCQKFEAQQFTTGTSELSSEQILGSIVPTIAFNSPLPSRISERNLEVQFSVAGYNSQTIVMCELNGEVNDCKPPILFLQNLSDGNQVLRIVTKQPSTGSTDMVEKIFMVDATGPVIHISRAPPNVTSAIDAEFDFSVSDQYSSIKSYECFLDSNAIINCTSGQTINGSMLPDGVHELRIDAYDDLGNKSTVSHKWSIDKTAPRLEINGPIPSMVRVAAIELSFVAEDSQSLQIETSCTVYKESSPYGSPLSSRTLEQFMALGLAPAEIKNDCKSPYNLNLPSDARYTIILSSKNSVQLTSFAKVEFFKDTTAPSLPSFTLADGAMLNGQTIDVGFNSVDAVGVLKYQCSIDSQEWADCKSPAVVNLGALTEGTHYFSVKAIDFNNNVASSRISFIADRTPPAIPQVKVTSNLCTEATASVEVSSQDNLTAVRFTVQDIAQGLSQTSEHPVFKITLSQANYNLVIKAVDGAGNSSTADSTRIDRCPPELHIGYLGGHGSLDGFGESARAQSAENIFWVTKVSSETFLFLEKNYNKNYSNTEVLIRRLQSNGKVDTVSKRGSDAGQDGPPGQGRVDSFIGGSQVTRDFAGTIYFIETATNSCIRKLDTGLNLKTLWCTTTNSYKAPVISGLGGAGMHGIAFDEISNSFFVTSGHAVYRLGWNGSASIFAGSPTEYGAIDGTGSAARFDNPTALALTPDGQIVLNSGGLLRIVDQFANVRTVMENSPLLGPYVGNQAVKIKDIRQMQFDRKGRLFGFTKNSFDNSGWKYFMIDELGKFKPDAQSICYISFGAIDEVATATNVVGFQSNTGGGTIRRGGGPDSGQAQCKYIAGKDNNGISYYGPGLTLDKDNYLLLAETSYNRIIKFDPKNSSVIAGVTNKTGHLDGPALTALFDLSTGGAPAQGLLAYNSKQELFVLDGGNKVIRKIDSSNNVSTVAGIVRAEGSIDGPANQAKLGKPIDPIFDSKDNLYFLDNGRIRVLSYDGQVKSLIQADRFSVDSRDNLVFYKNYCFYRYDVLTKQETFLAGICGNPGFKNGINTTAMFGSIASIAIDTFNNDIYFSETDTHSIRKIDSIGSVATVSGDSSLNGFKAGQHFGSINKVSTLSIKDRWIYARTESNAVIKFKLPR